MRSHHPRLLAAFVVVGMALTLAGCGGAGPETKSLAELRERGTIRVANTQINPPFSFVDDSGEVVGFDVDVAEEIARRVGIDDVEYVVGSFQTFIPGLQSGKWDAVIAGLTITEEREKQVAFSCPYLVNEISLFAAPGATEEVASVEAEEDLSGMKVGVTSGGVQEETVRQIEGVNVRTYDNSTLGLRDLSTGRIDVYVGVKFTGAYLADKNNLDVAPVEAELEGLLSSEVTGMAFPKDQDELRAAADDALAEMIADGTLSEISRRWFGGLDVAEGLKELPSC